MKWKIELRKNKKIYRVNIFCFFITLFCSKLWNEIGDALREKNTFLIRSTLCFFLFCQALIFSASFLYDVRHFSSLVYPSLVSLFFWIFYLSDYRNNITHKFKKIIIIIFNIYNQIYSKFFCSTQTPNIIHLEHHYREVFSKALKEENAETRRKKMEKPLFKGQSLLFTEQKNKKPLVKGERDDSNNDGLKWKCLHTKLQE